MFRRTAGVTDPSGGLPYALRRRVTTMVEEPQNGTGSAKRTTYSAQAERREQDLVIRLPLPGRIMDSLLPRDAVTHMRAAQRESLLAMRALIDSAVNALDEKGEGRQPPRRIDIAVE
jgi:hypothetical protein